MEAFILLPVLTEKTERHESAVSEKDKISKSPIILHLIKQHIKD